MQDKLQVLAGVPLLASLGEELMAGVAEHAEFITARKGDIIVRENAPGDALYAVVSGRLEAFATLDSGGEHVFAHYCNGDYFGEMPLLSGETQWASVRALSDSLLLKIPRDEFQAVVNRDPRVAVSVSRRMGHRIKQLREESRAAKGSTIIALYSALPEAGKTLFATNLVASLAHETREPVLLLDFSGRHRGRPLQHCTRLLSDTAALDAAVVHTPLQYDRLDLELLGDESEMRLIAPLFGKLSTHYDYVLVDLPTERSASVMECLLQSDRICVVTRDEDAHLDATRILLGDLRCRAGVEAKAQVVLTAVSDLKAPRMAEAAKQIGQEVGLLLRWIPAGEVVECVDGQPFVLRRPMDPYSIVVRRMARELGHQLVGLALGAGAARGLAHIGIIRILEREGISIDMVAGSSMGALVAASWAVGKSADEMEQIALKIRTKRAFLKLLDPVFPGSGFIRGLRVQNFLHTIVDDLTFADTLIPLKIVATDLSTLREFVFESGRLIDAIRASISIPGIFRPVSSNGHVLIDGGITNPVPVNVLAHAGVSKIIAVDTIPNAEHMRLREAARLALRNGEEPEKGPMHEVGPLLETPTGIINVYMRSMHVMQSRLAFQECANADIVIRPLTMEGTWYDFFHPERYIRNGEVAAEAALPELKKLVRA